MVKPPLDQLKANGVPEPPSTSTIKKACVNDMG